MITIKQFIVSRLSNLCTEGFYYDLKPNECYDNKNSDLYIKDTTGNYYKLPQQATITQRDIFIFVCGIKQVLNVDFERVVKTWE